MVSPSFSETIDGKSIKKNEASKWDRQKYAHTQSAIINILANVTKDISELLSTL